MRPLYFKSFDSFRFLSISSVTLHHYNTFAGNYGFIHFSLPILSNLTFLAVKFFFVGSGFLITYLLMNEYLSKGFINLKNYFVRRILRIFPSYYVLVIVSILLYLFYPFCSVPSVSEAYYAANPFLGFGLNIFFLPHISPFFVPTPPFTHHLYTVGIEEQFYLLWGLALFLLGFRFRGMIPIIFILFVSLNLYHYFFYSHDTGDYGYVLKKVFLSASTYLKYSHFTSFLIGSFFAFSVIEDAAWLHYFKRKMIAFAFYLLMLIFIFFSDFKFLMADEIASFLVIATFLFSHYAPIFKGIFENKVFIYLGKRSYGIYIFHMLAISLSCNILQQVHYISGIQQYVYGAFFSFLLAIILGWLSYALIESRFLKFRSKFDSLL